jgi:hypothetical protein
VERTADRPPDRLVTKRRLVVLVAVLAAVLVPLAAVGAANDWWFLNSDGSSPTPRQAPNVVKQGEWNGHPWQLAAWRSESSPATFPSMEDGLCFSVTPRGFPAEGEGGATSCNPFAGIDPMSETKRSEMTITFLGAAASKQLPSYIAGPVISEATAVEIRFGNGDVLRVPTFAAPRERLQRVRFYATPLPSNVQPTPNDPTWLKSVAGLDAKGKVIACLAPLTATDGISPLSDCR